MRELIEHQWQRYSMELIPLDAPDLQRVESRRAFYAGAQALLGTLLNALDPGTEPTEADLALLDQVKDELDGFWDRVKNGQA